MFHCNHSCRQRSGGDRVSVRDYLASLGFGDLDTVYAAEQLRQELLAKVSYCCND